MLGSGVDSDDALAPGELGAIGGGRSPPVPDHWVEPMDSERNLTSQIDLQRGVQAPTIFLILHDVEGH